MIPALIGIITINILILLWMNLGLARLERGLEYFVCYYYKNSQTREVKTLNNTRRLIRRVDRVLKKI